MDAKKRVIFIPYTLSQGGGAERVLAEYLENIDKTKYEIDILECHRGINTNILQLRVSIIYPRFMMKTGRV